MFKKIRIVIRSALSSFWLLPLVLSFLAVCLFVITYTVDNDYRGTLLAQYGPPFSIGPSGARQLMATIAGSLITVASLVFSMTLISLTVAASTIGARLMLRYMRNRSIQITLGVFLAGFIYALLTLSAVGAETELVPRLSVFVAMSIAVLCFIWLAFAFNDLAKAIQVDRAIAHLSESLCLALQRLQRNAGRSETVLRDYMPDTSQRKLMATRGGYVASINRDQLTAIADTNNWVVDLQTKIGSLVLPGEVLAVVYGVDDNPIHDYQCFHSIHDTILMTSSRSDLDDPFFCLRLLNEIAARALSPGLNDIYTALACVDHIALGVEQVIRDGLPRNGWKNSQGQLRIIFSSYYFDDFVDAAFEPMRRAGADSVALSLRLLDRLARLRQLASTQNQKRCLELYIDHIYQSAKIELHPVADCQLLDQAYSKVAARHCF